VREQREWFRVTLASIGDAVITCDNQGRITFLNAVAEQVTGWTIAEALGQPIQRVFRLINEQTRQPGDDPVARVLREGRAVTLANHTALLAKDGHACPIEDSAAPILDAARQVIGAVLVFHDVTGKRQAEEALLAAHQRTLRILESIGDGFFSLDRQWQVTHITEHGARLLGKGRADLLGRNLWESFPEAVGSPFQQAYERVLAEQVSTSVVAFHAPLNAWFEARAYPSAEGLSVFYQDITERKGLEDTLKFLVQAGAAPREDFFHELARHLAHSLGMDFVCIDRLLGDGLAAQTLAVYSDGKFEDNVEYTLKDTPCGEVVGKTVCCFPKGVRQLFPKDAVLQEMSAESYVGTTLWSFDAQPIGLIAVIGRKPLANPRLAESVLKVVAVRAAGELQRRQAEEALRQARDELELRVRERTAELRQSNAQLRQEIEVRRQTERELTEAQLNYRTVAEFTYDWEYWEAPDFRLNYCSPSCERITGYSAQEFMAEPGLLQQIVHPDDADLWQKHRQKTLAATGHRVVQFRIRKKDGSTCWLEHAWQPVEGLDGMFLGLRASNRDITDRKEEEMQTQQLREELAHVTRVTTAGQLAASLAHELNQPLTAIHCNAQTAEKLLAADPPNVAEVREALADIAHDSERAGAVIQRLRALFKKSAREHGVLDINEVIQETLDLLRSEFVLKGIAPTVHLEPALPKVLGNRVELQQVVLNLVVNALEAMAEIPSAARHLHIRTDRENPAALRASFRDFGPGIAESQLSRLFEPFFTTKASGMGMGLTISQSILEAHGGSLRAVNNPDRGATFHLTLPIHPGEHA
jgi:PAS domain S-box-containing protein